MSNKYIIEETNSIQMKISEKLKDICYIVDERKNTILLYYDIERQYNNLYNQMNILLMEKEIALKKMIKYDLLSFFLFLSLSSHSYTLI